MSYEKEQQRLQKLLEEILSDDEGSENLFGEDSADEYVPDEVDYPSSDSSDSPPVKKRRKKYSVRTETDQNLPSTSNCKYY